MGDELARQVEQVEVTDEQRARFLEILAADKMTGDAKALRQAGVAGTTGQLRAYARQHLADDAREARGWSLTKVENCTWEVATDKDHPAWDRANARILKAYHPLFRDSAHLEVTGANNGPIQMEGRRVVSLGEVVELARQLGVDLRERDAGDSRLALPSPPDVLSDPR